VFFSYAAMPALLREARATLALAVPIILGSVGQMLMGVIDSVMIGRVGTVPLAASALAGSVFSLFYIVGIGLLLPAAVLVSHSHGAGRAAECGEWLRHSLAVALAAGVLAAALMVALAAQMHRLGQPPEVIAMARPFFVIIAVSIIPAFLFQALRQYAESLGRPWLPMTLMLVGVGLNVLLNWVLIYGHLGAPALGLTGSGWATLSARVFGTVVLWIWLDVAARRRAAATGRSRAEAGWPARWWAALEPSRLRRMAHLGVPAGGQLLFEVGAFSAAAVMMGWLGATALAAHQIALSCAAITFMFPLGLAMAASMRLSKALGEGRRDALRPIGFGALGLSCLIMGAFAVVFAVGGRAIAGQFVQDPAVVALAARLLAVAALFQLFDGGQVVGSGILRGLSDVKLPALITFVAYWLIAIPGGYWFGVRGVNPVGIWAALAVGLGFAAIFFAWRFARLTRPLPDATQT
jgi:MATE family multidrug resistance protein